MNDLKLFDKLKKIKLIIYDVDGVMTDGRIILGNHPDDELKHFNVKDGLGIKLLQKLGIKQVILTGKQSTLVEKRFTHLGIDAIYQGRGNKIKTFEEIIARFHIKADAILMVGDDLPDLALMKRCGCSITVNDAHPWLFEYVDYISKAKGGKGAVREITDLILSAHHLKEKIIQDFIEFGEAKINVL
ncbi:HAD-IIIA family hydrolase [Thiotrichales bacterium 19S3-7]|nr:HAD-IIIA family hydrolase [Thiotrichales bacterium 19S3-7]MCF6801411.1 HAD-IIIA family hydrolase [Thiotrichales bacterium 19S3-11]